MAAGTTTNNVERCLVSFGQGDQVALDELVRCSERRLRVLARRMCGGFPALRDFVDTDDVFNESMLKYVKHLRKETTTTPVSARHFFAKASLLIRSVLIDLWRKHVGNKDDPHPVPLADQAGPQGGPAGQDSDDPGRLFDWETVHEKIAGLPPELREVFELRWYHDQGPHQIAKLLDVSVGTVRIRWTRARLLLLDAFRGESPF
jgi:RNA polymerase sigma factor (sigma-70 family)